MCESIPLVPVTVNVEGPVGTDEPTANVSVDVVEPGLGEKVPMTPEGLPLSDNVTGELNPFDGVIVVVELPAPPCGMITDVADKEKSGDEGAFVGTVIIKLVPIVAGPVVNTLPFIAIFAPVVIAVLLIIVPMKLVFAASVVAPTGTQKTWLDCAPLVNMIVEPATVFNAPVILKM